MKNVFFFVVAVLHTLELVLLIFATKLIC